MPLFVKHFVDSRVPTCINKMAGPSFINGEYFLDLCNNESLPWSPNKSRIEEIDQSIASHNSIRYSRTMCQEYVIIYRACKANSDRQLQLPCCTPRISQVREYVNSDGWQLCEECSNEEPCHQTPGVRDECTFIEPYCSDACEIYYEGSIVKPNASIKDRFAYVDVPAVAGSLPATANRGHLLVDFERVRLIYKALFDFVEKVLSADKETEYGLGVTIEFPITASFAAHAAALFLKSHKSGYCDRILLEFVEAMSVGGKIQILQRLIAAMSITRKFRIPSSFAQSKSACLDSDAPTLPTRFFNVAAPVALYSLTLLCHRTEIADILD